MRRPNQRSGRSAGRTLTARRFARCAAVLMPTTVGARTARRASAAAPAKKIFRLPAGRFFIRTKCRCDRTHRPRRRPSGARPRHSRSVRANRERLGRRAGEAVSLEKIAKIKLVHYRYFSNKNSPLPLPWFVNYIIAKKKAATLRQRPSLRGRKRLRY